MTKKRKRGASKTSKNWPYRQCMEAIRRAPLTSTIELCKRFDCSDHAVKFAKTSLLKEGFDAHAAGREIIRDYFNRNPNATPKQAAQDLGTTTSYVNWLRKAYQKETYDNVDKLDDAEIKTAIRPAWYVTEFRERGYLGVNLREDEFKRYIELYEYKRLGKHSPIVDYNKYRQSKDEG